MNYIELINDFWGYCEENHVSATEKVTYLAILNYCNKLNWKNPFMADWSVLVQYSGISKNSHYSAIEALHEMKLIQYKKGEKNKLKAEIFILKIKNKTKNNFENNFENKTKNKIENLDKLINIKTNKLINIEFDVFWNLYDKKVSKQKAAQKWAKLKDSDRERIIETLPAFIAGIKDKQYQPNPDTYLNNRRWEDEVPAPKPAQDEERHHDYRRYNNYEEYEYTCRTLKIQPRFTKEEFYAM